MSRHSIIIGKRTLIYYDTKEEIGGNPEQSTEVPEGFDPLSGFYMVISPFNEKPWVIAQKQPDFSHLGLAWKLIYASSGHSGKEIYSAREPDFNLAANPSFASRLANQRLNRESLRHFGDISKDDVLDQLNQGQTFRFNEAVSKFSDVDYSLIFYEHLLNRPEDEIQNLLSICFGIPELPASDRNSRDSVRESIVKWENLESFISSPMHIMTRLERRSIRDGFCLPKLHGTSHVAATQVRNRNNCTGS